MHALIGLTGEGSGGMEFGYQSTPSVRGQAPFGAQHSFQSLCFSVHRRDVSHGLPVLDTDVQCGLDHTPRTTRVAACCVRQGAFFAHAMNPIAPTPNLIALPGAPDATFTRDAPAPYTLRTVSGSARKAGALQSAL